MSQVITTASSTHCWKKSARPEVAAWRLLAGLLVVLWLCLAPAAVRADTPVTVEPVRLERSDDGVFLSTSVQFPLPNIVEDALNKGIAIHFVAEAELFRDRWYWYDRKVASAARHMRLAYQPLTRRWRLNVGPAPIGGTGLGLSLGQTFETLPDALSAIQRISRWRIADPADIESGAQYTLEFRFRLDTSQLPRPIQIGVAGKSDWSIAVEQRQRATVETER